MSLHLLSGFKQSPSHCGPACLKMILDYYNVTISEKELGIAAKTTLELGTSDNDLLNAARQYGLEGEWKEEAAIEDLRRYVQSGTPTIVEWFSTNEPHYSVVIDVTDTEIVMLDPEVGDRVTFAHDQFLAIWFMYEGTRVGGESSVMFPKSAKAFHVRKMLPLQKGVTL